MAARGKKTFELGFEIQYSAKGEEAGNFAFASALELEAPGRKYSEFHTTMVSWLAETQMKMMAQYSQFKELIDSIEEEELEASKRKAKKEGHTLDTVQGALGHEEYPKFYKYLIVNLTNTPMVKLAGTNIRVNDALWDKIEEAGGLEIIEEVMTAYLGFFPSMKQKIRQEKKTLPKTNGTGLSQTPASPIKGL